MREKRDVARFAVKAIAPGMRVGIGSGSTVFYFIEALGVLCQEGLSIRAVASSKESESLAREAKIPLMQIDDNSPLDITVDGADQIDENFSMIKGGGGALLREKILLAQSKKTLIIIDESKWVKKLGKRSLPVEITPFGYPFTIDAIERLGYKGSLRRKKGGSKKGEILQTDNGNYLYDMEIEEALPSPKKLHHTLLEIPGVMETGLFIDYAEEVLVGIHQGTVERRVKGKYFSN